MRGFLIAGPASGVGKTTISLAIAAGLDARGFCVQAFKCGPDFLDTGHLSAVTGRPALNLDGWMLDRDGICEAFAEGSADAEIAIVEGMMGLFDGISREGESGSSAEIAKILSLPVILVVDASKSARSIAAVIRGFEGFDSELRFAGVVLNGVASDGHYRLLADAVVRNCTTPVLGWVPQQQSVHIPERHLGLHTAAEIDWNEKRRALEILAKERLNLDLLLGPEFQLEAHKVSVSTANAARSAASNITIGVARDAAFCFYYQDNLNLLERAGARLFEFSPLQDAHLPPALDALYLGGGYPELHAEQLSSNAALLEEIRKFAVSGRPVYAECGGMMYLGERLRTSDGQVHTMAGVLPLETEMTEKLVRFGYVEINLLQDCLLGARGTVLRGHSFHHSRCTNTRDIGPAFQARYTLANATDEEGYARANIFASYIHLHFRGAPEIAKRFVVLAKQAASRIAEVR
ncbi:MAG TPA: cobyrinate a,c-diamide synthase [Acidisarcina sp.]|nr:cobyrinate a,c-diamide synthase [Acidisarcina sp.]